MNRPTRKFTGKQCVGDVQPNLLMLVWMPGMFVQALLSQHIAAYTSVAQYLHVHSQDQLDFAIAKICNYKEF